MKLEFNDRNDGGYLRDVVFAYVKLQKPGLKYGHNKKPKIEQRYEYTVDAVINEEIFDKIEEISSKISLKKYKTGDEFETKFKMKSPLPGEKKQYVVKFKADAQYKDGQYVPYEYFKRPKAYVPVEGGAKDITNTTLVGNGSVGDLSFSLRSDDDGTYFKLTGILVKELVVYEDNKQDSAFGVVVNKEEAKNVADKNAARFNTPTNAPSNATPPGKKEEEEKESEMDNDPFS